MVDCIDEAHMDVVREAVDGLDGVQVISCTDRTFEMHLGGKVEVVSTLPLRDRDDLSMAYTPGVARVCMAIHESPERVHELTIKKNTVAIVTDGTAVLGLGNIGPAASLPVMEGKALLFKNFAGVDAFPICVDTSGCATPEEEADAIVETVQRIATVFGGINLEDIAAPACFAIEERLRSSLDIPVFHDDQHGTAVVTLAALTNALRIVEKDMADLKVVISGAGAAGVAITKILMAAGVREIIACDSKGILTRDRADLHDVKVAFAAITNPSQVSGSLSDAMSGADVFIGVSGPDVLTVDDVKAMASDAIVFAMANPDPEIRPELAREVAAIVATGRSDFPNQINNVLAFPGIFRGALDAGATTITEGMKVAAARAIAAAVPEEELTAESIVPSVFQPEVVELVAAAVAAAAIEDGVIRGS